MKLPVVLQPDAFQLGDFIQLMPALTALARQHGRPVPVHFETARLARIFGRSPAIRVVRARPRAVLNFFHLPALAGPRYRHHVEWARRLLGLRGRVPWPSVPVVGRATLPPGRRYCAILRGSRVDAWHAMKDPGDRIYRRIYDRLCARDVVPVFLGGANDVRWWFERMNGWGDAHVYAVGRSLEDTLALLRACDCAVANDTGLAHVAAAYRVPLLVLWKRTPIAWRPPQPWVTAAMPSAWRMSFDAWLESRA